MEAGWHSVSLKNNNSPLSPENPHRTPLIVLEGWYYDPLHLIMGGKPARTFTAETLKGKAWCADPESPTRLAPI